MSKTRPTWPRVSGGQGRGSSVLAGRRIDVFEQPLGRPDQPESEALHDARVPQRERRSRNPADNHHDHHQREDRKADPTVVIACREDVVEVRTQTRREHQRDVRHDEE